MLQKQFNISNEDLGLYSGLVDFADSFTSFISSAFVGYLSDIYGKKPLLVVSLLCSFLRLVLYAFIRDVRLLIGVECLYGFVNCTSVMVTALMVEFSTNENRVRLFGYMTASYALSRSLSSLVGGLLVHFESGFKVDNPYAIYSLLSACLTLVSIVLSHYIPLSSSLEQPRSRNSNTQDDLYYPNSTLPENLQRFLQNWFKELKWVANKKALLLIMCRGMISFASSTLLWTLFAFTPLRDYGLDLSSLKVGLIFMMYGLISFGFQFVLFDRVVGALGLRGTFILGGFLSATQLLLLPISPLPYWSSDYQPLNLNASLYVVTFISIGVALYAVGEVMRPALDAMIVNTTDLGKQGIVQGVSRMSHVFCDAIGSMIVGWLYSYFVRTGHPIYVFVFSATFYLVPALVVYRMDNTLEVHAQVR